MVAVVPGRRCDVDKVQRAQGKTGQERVQSKEMTRDVDVVGVVNAVAVVG